MNPVEMNLTVVAYTIKTLKRQRLMTIKLR